VYKPALMTVVAEASFMGAELFSESINFRCQCA